MIDEAYTAGDHAFRDDDAYAKGKYELTLRWLRAADGRRSELVNVGCGAGLFSAMAAADGYSVRAYEPDPVAFAEAARAAPSRVTVEQRGLADVPGPAAPVVVLHDVLEHIEDEAGAVDRLARLVEGSGLLVVSVPALPSLFGFHDEQLGHFRRYTKATLRAALEPWFEIDRMRYYGLTFIPLTAWFSRWRRKPYPTAGVGGRPSLVGRAFAAACRAESRVPTPLGTSLVCLARPRPDR